MTINRHINKLSVLLTCVIGLMFADCNYSEVKVCDVEYRFAFVTTDTFYARSFSTLKDSIRVKLEVEIFDCRDAPLVYETFQPVPITFEISSLDPGGLNGTNKNSVVVLTDSFGNAAVTWRLGGPTKEQSLDIYFTEADSILKSVNGEFFTFGATRSNPIQIKAFGLDCDTAIQLGSKLVPIGIYGRNCWMLSNLNFGDTILPCCDFISIPIPADNGRLEKYCYGFPRNMDDQCDMLCDCDVFGALYPWDEMMMYEGTVSQQGICPMGWKIPSDEDWIFFERQLGVAEEDLYKEGWRAFNTDKFGLEPVSGTDSLVYRFKGTDFYIPLGGKLNPKERVYTGKGIEAFFWTSTEFEDGGSSLNPEAWARQISICDTCIDPQTGNIHKFSIRRFRALKSESNSCRCVDD
ncbi:MAG: fibrobacter succinogenes major paralogous domain-containing protein [Bacteroidia bacterium]|nr:fibrobacter succinogenes major paralogous domain-containing protein [Bacteroidia bacterium]